MSKKSSNRYERSHTSNHSCTNNSNNHNVHTTDLHQHRQFSELANEHNLSITSQTRNGNKITNASSEELDENLYETSDTYQRTLEFLKKRLINLRLSDTEMVNNVSKDIPFLDSTSIKHNSSTCTKECNNDGRFTEVSVDTSTSCLNVNNELPFAKGMPNCNSSGGWNTNECIDEHNLELLTIYRTSEMKNSSTTSSSASYNVPRKRICLQSVAGFDQITNFFKENSNSSLESSSTTTITKINALTRHSQSSPIINSTTTNTSTVVPTKRICLRPRLPSFTKSDSSRLCVNEKLPKKTSHIVHITPLTEGHANHTVDSKNESETSYERFELGLNFPSSIVSEDTPRIKSTLLEPRVVVIDNSEKSRRRIKRNNKVTPNIERIPKYITSSDSEVDTCNKTFYDLVMKYNQDSPEISSIQDSTPPCNISTCASKSSSFLSPTTKQSWIGGTPKSPKTYRVPCPLSKPLHSCLKIFNPIFSSSLDVPRMYTHSSVFPLFTQFTTLNYMNVCEVTEANKEEPIDKCRDYSYTNTAKRLIEEHCSSKKLILSDESNNCIPKDDSLKRCGAEKYFMKKPQSTELSFYIIPSTASEEEQPNTFCNSETESDLSEDDNNCTTCFCYKFCFSNNKSRSFT